jgi:hypothetical protein
MDDTPRRVPRTDSVLAAEVERHIYIPPAIGVSEVLCTVVALAQPPAGVGLGAAQDPVG